MGVFKGIFWSVFTVAVMLGSYMMTLQGASERAKLAALETNIVKTQKEIRSLDTEFKTLANMERLGEWNGATLKLGAPGAQQFLASENQLASIDALPQVEPAVAVVPGGALKAEVAPAVVQTASLDKHDATANAKSDIRNGGLAKVRGSQKVAMLDKNLIDELEKNARIERSSLPLR
jgi:hypothetical protein